MLFAMTRVHEKRESSEDFDNVPFWRFFTHARQSRSPKQGRGRRLSSQSNCTSSPFSKPSTRCFTRSWRSVLDRECGWICWRKVGYSSMMGRGCNGVVGVLKGALRKSTVTVVLAYQVYFLSKAAFGSDANFCFCLFFFLQTLVSPPLLLPSMYKYNHTYYPGHTNLVMTLVGGGSRS
jgi:hypothetical protein